MKRKGYHGIVIILVGVLCLLTYLEASTPTPINWNPSYAKYDKIPLGAFVIHTLFEKAYPKLQDVHQPPYEFLNANESHSGTYFFVNDAIHFDPDELDDLLDWVVKGNTLFVSAHTISEHLLDTLHITMDTKVSLNQIQTKPLITLVNADLKSSSPCVYSRDTQVSYFSKIDTMKTTVLGVTDIYKDTLVIQQPKINYIQQSFGEGTILLHTFPEAFSNHFILEGEEQYTYTQNLCAYLPKQTAILWDNYYKSGKTRYAPLYFMLSNRYLKWAYYMIGIGIVIFVLFEGKRKQRSIPIRTPLQNQTLAFTRTISDLYLQKEAHAEIVAKQSVLFMDYVRTTLRISTDKINKQTLEHIASRSDNTVADTQALFKYIETLRTKVSVTADDVMQLHTMIQAFKNTQKHNKI